MNENLGISVLLVLGLGLGTGQARAESLNVEKDLAELHKGDPGLSITVIPLEPLKSGEVFPHSPIFNIEDFFRTESPVPIPKKSKSFTCVGTAIEYDPIQTGPSNLFPPQPRIKKQNKVACTGSRPPSVLELRVSTAYTTPNKPFGPFLGVNNKTPVRCFGSYRCQTPIYTYTVSKTKHLFTAYSVRADSASASTQSVAHYNNRGYYYPPVSIPQGKLVSSANHTFFNPPGLVKFPSPPWDRCDDNPKLKKCIRKNEILRENTKKVYRANGWTIPTGASIIHHIKPINFGGGNNNGNNGVFLTPKIHEYFNQWWNYGRFTFY